MILPQPLLNTSYFRRLLIPRAVSRAVSRAAQFCIYRLEARLQIHSRLTSKLIPFSRFRKNIPVLLSDPQSLPVLGSCRGSSCGSKSRLSGAGPSSGTMLYASTFFRWLQRKRYQYEVTFSLYMLTPTEKFIFSMIYDTSSPFPS